MILKNIHTHKKFIILLGKAFIDGNWQNEFEIRSKKAKILHSAGKFSSALRIFCLWLFSIDTVRKMSFDKRGSGETAAVQCYILYNDNDV